MPKTFLAAEWRKLVMANYAVDPGMLQPYLPHKTEIDLWNNTCYVSLVGFMFLNTRLKGIRIPFHAHFEEVNLRFYVRSKGADQQWKRGVVFIKEIVPRPALTWVANTVYGENYQTMPMRHQWSTQGDSLAVEYQWKQKQWHTLRVNAEREATALQEGSEAEFITEHYWGYTKLGDRKTSEYGVEHPPWRLYTVKDYDIRADFGMLYGETLQFLNHAKPQSVFLAEGSEIVVKEGRQL